MIDLMPMIRTELLEDLAVASFVGDRVRVLQAAPDDARKPFRAFLVLVNLGPIRLRGVPVQEVTVAVNCYGATPLQARSLYDAVSEVVHDIGPRIGADGEGIYISADDAGGEDGTDPTTGQPLVTCTLSYIGTTIPVNAFIPTPPPSPPVPYVIDGGPP